MNVGEMDVKSSLVGLGPYVAMVMVECLYVGLSTLTKAAMTRGMKPLVFVVYSNALATLIVFPTSFIFQRQSRPPLTFTLLCKFFILGLFGITVMQNFYTIGVSYSSPTLASALSNLTPAFTFLLALLFRMEKVDLRSSISQLKILGTLVSISGALVITLYEGFPIISAVTIQSPSISLTNLLFSVNNWVIGGIFIAAASFSAAIWNTYQAAVLKEYPSVITIVAYYCLFGTIQCAVVALIAERDNLIVWNLSPNIELIAIIYSAICVSVGSSWAQAWCIGKKGPVFVALFKPLAIAIAAFMSFIFLGDTLYVGSVIGAVIIAVGFYGVMWAVSKEDDKYVKHENNEIPSSASQRTPLLHSYIDA